MLRLRERDAHDELPAWPDCPRPGNPDPIVGNHMLRREMHLASGELHRPPELLARLRPDEHPRDGAVTCNRERDVICLQLPDRLDITRRDRRQQPLNQVDVPMRISHRHAPLHSADPPNTIVCSCTAVDPSP